MSDSINLFSKLNAMEDFYNQISDKRYELPIIDVSELTEQDAAQELKDLNVHFSQIDKEELKKLSPGERIKVYEQIQKIRELLTHSILDSGRTRPPEVQSRLFRIFDKSRMELLTELKELLTHKHSSPGKSNLKKKSVKKDAGSQMAGLNTLENYLTSIKLEGEYAQGKSVSFIYPKATREIRRNEKYFENDFAGEYIIRHGMKTLSLVNKELDNVEEFKDISEADKIEILNQIQTCLELIDTTFVSQSKDINDKHSKYLFYHKTQLRTKLDKLKESLEKIEPKLQESPKEPEKPENLEIPKKQALKKSVKFDVPEEPEVRTKEQPFDLTVEDTLTMLENLMQKIRAAQ